VAATFGRHLVFNHDALVGLVGPHQRFSANEKEWKRHGRNVEPGGKHDLNPTKKNWKLRAAP